MSYVNEYIQTFAGEAALSLLRCMAIANGNNSLDSITLTQSEATRYIVTYSQNVSLADYNNWEMLMDEIYYELKDMKSDPNSIRRYICRMMMKLRLPAAYYHSPKDNANEKAINAFFACIMRSIQKAITMLEALGYTDISLGEYNRKWDKQSFHDVCIIGNSLERFGNIIQGCLYENAINTPVFDFQSQCGVKLVESVTADSLIRSMDWTPEMAQYYMHSGDSKKRIIPLCTIPELKQAIDDGKINEKGVLLVSQRAFVQYCYDNRFFLPLNKKDWERIDSLLTSSQGKTLTSGDLAQVAHQLQKGEYLDHRTRYRKK